MPDRTDLGLSAEGVMAEVIGKGVKFMKKIACVLLGMIMTVVSLSGCGNNPGGSGGAVPRDPYVNGSPAGNDGSAYAADEGEAVPADRKSVV